MTVLAVRGVSVQFGGLNAVDDVTFDLRAGGITGLIGPNGAGKTTLFDAICGLVRITSGVVMLADHDITRLPSYVRAARGLGRSFQDGRLFPSLTVEECISTALVSHVPIGSTLSAMFSGPTARSRTAQARTRTNEIIEMTGLGTYAEMFVRDLSTGTRRLVDLACALAHRPTVLLLDEPSSGIAQREVEALGPVIKGIRDRSECTMLLIEHDIPLVSSISDELLVMETGRLIARGRPKEVIEHPEVVRAYIGASHGPVTGGRV